MSMTAEKILQVYRSIQAVSLAAWLGNPMTRSEAGSCLALLRNLSRDCQGYRPESLNQRLAKMIARYWAGQGAEMDYCNLAATVGSTRDKAQLEFCYGQLLLAQKLENAWQHLDTGFTTAANLLRADEYFVVLNRHERLRLLALSSGAAAGAACLDELLREAHVIRQLQGYPPRYQSGIAQHQDTVD
jgi:hypothetical protein